MKHDGRPQADAGHSQSRPSIGEQQSGAHIVDQDPDEQTSLRRAVLITLRQPTRDAYGEERSAAYSAHEKSFRGCILNSKKDR